MLLEDGRQFVGMSCGAPGTVTGEVCFNTAMTGYTEVLTDPSYHGQILCLTTAEVGVYGVAPEDAESSKIQVNGFIVRHLSRTPSNWRSRTDLGRWLEENRVVAVEGIDTRALTRHLRGRGAMRGTLSTDADLTDQQLLDMARDSAGVIGQDFTGAVSRKKRESWEDGEAIRRWYDLAKHKVGSRSDRLRIVLVDLGLKSNIARQLAARGCEVSIMPAGSKAAEILDLDPDAVLFGNGPGDPSACVDVIDEIEDLVGKKPLGGICLGHQLIALACGAKTTKLPFGHRGSNHPVRVVKTGRVLITSQNHGFAVRQDSVQRAELEITHLSLNDGTVEGFRHRALPIMSVQFHPEASPGPHDAHDDFFDAFLTMVEASLRGESGAETN